MYKISPIYEIRNSTSNEEIDYNLLITCLQHYKSPRDVITRLLKRKELIRVKKGIYVFGDLYRRRLISLEVLSNQIYGPSYVSREFALQYYGFIPEGVEEITCMTTKKNIFFNTVMGCFSYKHLSMERFSIGVTLLQNQPYSALIATPEKAIVDFIYNRKDLCQNQSELLNILLNNYRCDEYQLRKLNIKLLQKIAKVYNYPTINLLPVVIKDLKNA